MRYKLQRVVEMPTSFDAGILYVSEEFETAAHLCACGCNSKVRTPLGPTEWTFTDDPDGPSLWPSIGNWQKPCRSHYWLHHGHVHWAEQWSEEKILAARRREQMRREDYYAHRQPALWRRAWDWIARIWKI